MPHQSAARMFGALFDAGVAGIGVDDVLVTVQQFVDLGDIRHVGCRAYHAVYQPRLIIHADVRLHAKVILVPFLALVHFRVALAVLVRQFFSQSQKAQATTSRGCMGRRDSGSAIAVDGSADPRRAS